MKMMNKVCALVLSVALCAGMAAPAFAYGGEPVEEVEQPVLTSTTDEEDVVTVTDEETGALTPEGNLTLVDDYHTNYSDGSGQQFITLVSKSGATFYLVIDRNAKGQQTVHFMNLVDEADLLTLMEEDAADAYTAEKEAAAQAEQDKLKAEEEAKKAAEEAAASGEEQPKENKVTKIASGFLGVVVLIALAAGGGFYVVYWNDDPIIRKELEKYQIKAKKCPFSILKKEGMIGYLADGQYVIEYPTPFNMEQESLALTGKHNMYNSLAAGITADIAGVKNEVIRQSLSDFEGVEHRLEKVVRVRGVDYINDSKATNVDACWYALESMKTPTVLILGGKDKGNDYEAIAELVRKKCVGLVFLGADNGKLHAFFDSFGIPIADTHSMKDCVEACYRMARPGDTVLLSPCCASFDLFKNMEDRGEQFKSLVRAL